MIEALLTVSHQTVANAGLFLILTFIVSTFIQHQRKRISLPLLSYNDGENFTKTMSRAYHSYREKLYALPETPNKWMLPTRYLDEIKSLPDTKLSFVKEIFIRQHGTFTQLGTHNHTLINVIKIDLARNVEKILDTLQDEMHYAAKLHIGTCEKWCPIPVYQSMLEIVTLLSGRVFVGLPLSRDEDWIDSTKNYTVNAATASDRLSDAGLLRNFMGYFMPEVRAVRAHKATIQRLLKPLVEERLAAMKSSGIEQLNDTVDFIIKQSGNRSSDIPFLASMQMQLSFVAIHTTSMNLTHAIYDLAARPEYMQPLREELFAVLGAENGVLSKTSIAKLKKMDSFLKECQRLNPPSAVSLQRLAMTDVELSTGLKIPKGTSLAVNSMGINLDPEKFPDPEVFDGFRFSKLREQPGSEAKFQLVTTGTDSINFGHGKQACPGRFFASNEIKVVLAYIIQNYDIKLMGERRPENIYLSTNIMPNPQADILFRRHEQN